MQKNFILRVHYASLGRDCEGRARRTANWAFVPASGLSRSRASIRAGEREGMFLSCACGGGITRVFGLMICGVPSRALRGLSSDSPNGTNAGGQGEGPTNCSFESLLFFGCSSSQRSKAGFRSTRFCTAAKTMLVHMKTNTPQGNPTMAQ